MRSRNISDNKKGFEASKQVESSQSENPKHRKPIMNNNVSQCISLSTKPALSTGASMTSKDISELLDVRHDSVLRTIKRLATLGTITLPPLVEKSSGGRPTTIYRFQDEQGKRDSIIVVAQLSPEVTAKIVDRWQELEKANQFDPAKLSRSDILRLALDAEEENQKLTAKIEQDKPLVDFAEKHEKSDGWFCLRDAAKQVGCPPKKFNDWLYSNNYIFRQGGKHWMPYSDKIKSGLFKVKSGVRWDEEGEEKATQQCMVTAKGIQHFAQRLNREGLVA